MSSGHPGTQERRQGAAGSWRETLSRLEGLVAQSGGAELDVDLLLRSLVSVQDVHDRTLDRTLEGLIRDACRSASHAILDRTSTIDDRARLKRVMDVLSGFRQALQAAKDIDATLSKKDVAASPEDLAAAIQRLSAVDGDIAADAKNDEEDDEIEGNPLQQLIQYVLNRLQQVTYRRVGNDCYRERKTPEGQRTHAWDRFCTIEDFVYEETRKDVNPEMWMHLTSSRGMAGAVVDHLVKCHDTRFPDLKRDRHVFAFSNGLYRADLERFVPYGSDERVPDDVVSANVFEGPFDASLQECEIDQIDTKHFQSILDYQDMGSEVSRWMYVLIGRLIYWVNELDGWQVIPYLKGAASSGKSTILTRVCRRFYDMADVGVLSNNIERKFGVSALCDKFLFIGPEIKADIQLEQAEFQSIVSGESIQVAVKHELARTIEWRVPGILAGNEVPGWVDNSGSINRRIVLFDFPKRVEDGDMELGAKLQSELPALIMKCNRAYREAVRLYAKRNLWMSLPQAFHRTRDEFVENVNPIVAFLNSGALVFDPDACMPLDVFRSMYREFARNQGTSGRPPPANHDTLRAPLAQKGGCYLTASKTNVWRNDARTCRWIMGLDMATSSVGGNAGDALEPR
jgi:phage/plasmid-associated DNA primase